jgi:hypothetical protein
MRTLLILALVLASSRLSAEPMHFLPGGNDTRCEECAFIQASGEITPDTPKAFEAYIAAAPHYAPKRIRLDSPGGNLGAGVALGEIIRARGYATEVGSDQVDPDGHPAFGGRASERTKGQCASACAYAYLGGIERRLDGGSQLGFHRFYQQSALAEPTAKAFSGQDLDETQKLVAALVLYVMRMGADARVVALATEAGPNEMYWIQPEEARELRVVYEPRAWKPWRLETWQGGVVAISDTNDGSRRMSALCTKRLGPQVVLIDMATSWDVAGWFEQCRNHTFEGYHPVFGAKVSPSQVQVIRRKEGGAAMRFRLSTNSPPFTTPALLDASSYDGACSSEHYQSTMSNFREAVQIALRNCFVD